MKKFNVKTSSAAKIDLGEITDYLSQFSEGAASKQLTRIFYALDGLEFFPYRGKASEIAEIAGVRQINVDRYKILYVFLMIMLKFCVSCI